MKHPVFQWQLDGYVLRLYAMLYSGNLIAFTLLYVMIDLFESLEDFDSRAQTAFELMGLLGKYYLAVIPTVFCQLLGPVVALTSGLFAVTMLARSNELVPMLASGRPFWRIVMPIFVSSLFICGATFLVQELWIPRTADIIKEVTGTKDDKRVLENRTYYDRKEGILIEMKRYFVVEQRAEDVTVFPLPGHERADESEFFIWARKMNWVTPEKGEPYWLVRDGQIQEYDPRRSGGT
ncbi:MAG: LptF/LptG family permease, partial [Planctomycetota bacterium]